MSVLVAHIYIVTDSRSSCRTAPFLSLSPTRRNLTSLPAHHGFPSP
jgi:hypothetical protein